MNKEFFAHSVSNCDTQIYQIKLFYSKKLHSTMPWVMPMEQKGLYVM